MNIYRFFGWEHADAAPLDKNKYRQIQTPRDLYDILSEVWCEETCAPRMREHWSPENRTLGQCSITAFLAQDIFGGEVYGVLLPEGGFHCFNKVGDCIFDLTSEQLGSMPITYTPDRLQRREEHFLADPGKAERYALLKYETERTLKRRQQAASPASGIDGTENNA